MSRYDPISLCFSHLNTACQNTCISNSYLVLLSYCMQSEFKEKIVDFESNIRPQLQVALELSNKIFDACNIVNKSWSQSTLATHAVLYYNDFEEPQHKSRFNIEWGLVRRSPAGWVKKNEQEVKSKIHDLSQVSISLDEYLNLSGSLQTLIKDWHQEIISIIEIVDIPPQLEFNLKKIREYEVGSWADKINQFLNRNLMTRDQEAITSGKLVPVHISMLAFSSHMKQLCKEAEDLLKTLERLTKQMGNQDPKKPAPSIDDSRLAILEEAVSGLISSHQELEAKLENYRLNPKTASSYIASEKIDQLASLNLQEYQYDLSKLVQLCKEMNSAYESQSYLSCSFVGRTILNHIPPIFSMPNFTEFANKRGSSQKKLFQKLDDTLKNIANHHLHEPISTSTVLPSEQQIDLKQAFDMLLSEIIAEVRKNITSVNNTDES